MRIRITSRVKPQASPRCRPRLIAAAFVAYLLGFFTLVMYLTIRAELL
jgi:hypothetical protein